MNESGTIYWPSNGRRQEGHMIDNHRDGQGLFQWPYGLTQEGSFKMDKRHGQGVLLGRDGTRYAGTWQNDQKHGIGVVQVNGNDVQNVFQFRISRSVRVSLRIQ